MVTVAPCVLLTGANQRNREEGRHEVNRMNDESGVWTSTDGAQAWGLTEREHLRIERDVFAASFV